MSKINLIPSELSVGGPTNKLAKQLIQASTIGAAISIFTILVLLGIFLFYSNDLKKVTADTNDLKEQIAALQKSEQKLVFAKDRLEKIKKVQGLNSALEELSDFEFLYDYLKGKSDIFVTEVGLDSDKLEITLNSTSLSSTTVFFDYLNDNAGEFSKVTLSIFSYNPLTGYVLGLEFEN